MIYRPQDNLDLIGEFSFEYGVENVADGKNYETVMYFTPGFKYETEKGFEIGLGVPVGLSYESADWGVIAQLQYEWGGKN